MSGGWEELLAEAQEKLAGQQDEGPNGELGDEMTPQPEEYFAGRYRGVGTMQTKRGPADVFLVWDRDGKPGFLYRHARLAVEVDVERPDVGDEVLILRGPTEYFEKDGEQRQVYPYVLRKRACSDPPPAGGPASPAGESPLDDDIPFAPTI